MGVGGGILLVPLLVHALGTRQHEAQGTSLAFVTATAHVATRRPGNCEGMLVIHQEDSIYLEDFREYLP